MSCEEIILNSVCDTIEKHEIACADTPILLMVSGGSDSAALAYICATLRDRGIVRNIEALHVNHCIRGRDADNDEAFVVQLCEILGIKLNTARIDIPAIVANVGGNVEAVARHERYREATRILQDACNQSCVPFAKGRIFVAHTQDDRVENFYMRSIVGTGPGGFRSMRYVNGNVARPLLDVSKQDLRDYLHDLDASGAKMAREHGALWCEDATNAHTDMFRAFVRHKMVPVARERNTALLDTLTRTMNLIADEDDFMESVANDAMIAHVEHNNDSYKLKPEFGCVALPIQRRVIFNVLHELLGTDARIETSALDAILLAFEGDQPKSGYSCNIQGNLAVSSNKRGVLIEPMHAYRARRGRV